MAGGYSAPGVYRKEIDLSDVLISNGISNGGTVVRAKKGPVRRPVLVTNSKEYIETFGQPVYETGLSETIPAEAEIGGKLVPELGYGSYGAIEFLKESSTLYVVRAYDADDKYSTVEITTSATGINYGGLSALDTPVDVFDTSTRISTYDEYDKAGNIQEKLLVGFVGPGVDGDNYAVTIETINPQSEWLYSYDEYPTEISATVGTIPVEDPNSTDDILVPEIWGTSGSPEDVYTYFPIASEVIKVSVYKKPDNKHWDELYSNINDANLEKLRLEPLEVFYGSMSPMYDEDRNELFIEKSINGNSKFIYVKSNGNIHGIDAAPTASWDFTTPGFKLPDGTDDAGPFVYNNDRLAKLEGGTLSISSGLLDSDSDQKYWEYFNNREEIAVQIIINSNFNQANKVAVGELCNIRRDCMAANQVGDVTMIKYNDIINNEKYGYPASSFMSLYSAYSRVYDTYNDKYVYLPNSIFAASIFARVDNIADPWYAPAGVARATMTVLDQNKIYSLDHIGKMYDRNINSIKFVQGAGFVIWGQKTAQLKKSALDRINVRRNLIYIQTNIENSLNQFLFENNTLQTRLRVYSLVDNFLANIKAGDGLYDYKVVVDESNNPPSVIDANQMNVDIYLQPVKTIEFIQFTTVVTRTGVSFSDVKLKYV